MKNLIEIESVCFSGINSHYWDGKGTWKEEFDKLTEEMPARGAAQTLNVELVRAVNRLYYDYCNNGNMNAADVKTVSNWDEDDDEEEEISWNPYYEKFYELIESTLQDVESELTFEAKNEILNALKTVDDLVLNYGYISDEFSDKNMHAYDVLVDFVCWYCLNHIDKQLPSWYELD